MTTRQLVSAAFQRLAHPLRHWRTTLAVWLVIGLAAAGVAVWQHYEDRLFPKNWGVVEDGRIYRSGMLHEALVESTLRKHGIRVVLSLTTEEARADQDAEREVTARLGIERVSLPLAGNGTGDVAVYAAALETIARARREGKPILVHCVAGAKRTGGVVATWRVLVEKKPPDKAYAEMVNYGCRQESNRELFRFLNDHMAELAALLVQKGIIDRAPQPPPRLGP